MDHLPARIPLGAGLTACAGIFVAIAILACCSFELKIMLALGSFGSTSVLLFCFPDNHFSQPRSILGGHALSTAVGLAALWLFGKQWWALAGAVALAAALMMLSQTIHPPAGSNPLIVFLTAPSWDFLLYPTLAGALVLVLVGVAWHRGWGRRYPRYWFGIKAEPTATSRTLTACNPS